MAVMSERIKIKRSGGYTLIQVFMVFFILMASIVTVLMMLKPAILKAGIQTEQKHLSSIVDDIRGGFGRTKGSYLGLANVAL